MIPRNSDIFVCTYPKCGTTWIQHICSQLMTDNYGPQVGSEVSELCMTSPMIERMGAEFANNLSCPRLLKTHFAWYNIPKNPNAKYIFAVRNPKDCLTSYFFHNRNFKIYNYEHGKFSNFFELFLTKNIAFGNYFDHLISWLPHIHDDNILFLKYEDMYANLRHSVQQIGQFIGGKAAERIQNDQILDQIVENSTIKSMKKDQWRWFPENNLHQNTFIRKGGSRDWKNYFSREQSDRLDSIFHERLDGTIAEQWWKDEMAWNLEENDNNDDEYDDGIDLDFNGLSDDTNSSRSSRRASLEDSEQDSIINAMGFSNLQNALQKYIPWRERLSSQSSSGYNSLSSSLY
ncbi:unnamed protein product [Thelazia callipaeda]|uniref:Sulfotransfer_1 domain-containing protein n=1 Tax=Thelazia callipaeda TaxID=103827 RepID=A0A0N5CRQ9_THECL|nr:unnamed protein product [Thelazia callipaeda]